MAPDIDPGLHGYSSLVTVQIHVLSKERALSDICLLYIN
jgi:hypothetical protein